jgi:hypothetical protein
MFDIKQKSMTSNVERSAIGCCTTFKAALYKTQRPPPLECVALFGRGLCSAILPRGANETGICCTLKVFSLGSVKYITSNFLCAIDFLNPADGDGVLRPLQLYTARITLSFGCVIVTGFQILSILQSLGIYQQKYLNSVIVDSIYN